MKILETIPAGTYMCDCCGCRPAPYVCVISGGDYCERDGCVEGSLHKCLPREEIPYRFLPYTNDFKERYGNKTRDCIEHLEFTAYCDVCHEAAKAL